MRLRAVLSALAGLALAFAFVLPTAPAAAAPPPPPGSYMQSCVYARMDGPMLIARCRQINGGWNVSAVNLTSCRNGGDISNQDGNLSCPRGGGGIGNGAGWNGGGNNGGIGSGAGWNGGGNNGGIGNGAAPGWRLPPGSYRASCVKEFMQGPILTANCRDVQGRYRNTALDMRSCRANVTNVNGQLVCTY